MAILTREELTKALMNRIGYSELSASMDADSVLQIFGFEERIIDNVLESEERHLFYLLEEYGFLTTGREESTLYDGREWRTHYWILKRKNIKEWSSAEEKEEEAPKPKRTVYDEIPEEAWESEWMKREEGG
jgi:hypothetical protein